MNVNRNIVSALLGIALLTIPITASAHSDRDHDRYRIVPIHDHYDRDDRRDRHDRDDYYRHDRDDRDDRDDYYRHDRDDWHRPNRENCALPPYPRYRPNYQPSYYSQIPAYQPGYAAAPYPNQDYAAPAIGGGLANLINQRNNAQLLYAQAVRNGNRVRAKHLNNDIRALNNRIAGNELKNGYSGLGAYNSPYADPYGYNNISGGYGNAGLASMLGPLLGNYIH